MADADLQIFAFGDSLTAGYYGCKTHPVLSHDRPLGLPTLFHPYAPRLQTLVNEYLSSQVSAAGLTASVSHIGHSGFHSRVLVPMLRDELSGTHKNTNILVFLAGTNDLLNNRLTGAPRGPREIFHDIAEAHKSAHAQGISTVVVTLPEVGFAAFVPVSFICVDFQNHYQEFNVFSTSNFFRRLICFVSRMTGCQQIGCPLSRPFRF